MKLSDLFGGGAAAGFAQCSYAYYATGTNITDSIITSTSSLIVGIQYYCVGAGGSNVVNYTLKNGTAIVYQGYMGLSTAGSTTFSDRNAAAILCPNGIRLTLQTTGMASFTLLYKTL
jgi:hypothetical protein